MVNTGSGARWDPGRLAVGVVAAVFFLAGVLGVASGTGFGVPLAAANDAVHLVLGVSGLAVARSRHGARTFLIAGGVVYFLWLYGGAVVLTDGAAPTSPSTVNDWLNMWLAVSMIALACLVGDRQRSDRAEAARAAELSASWRQVRVSAAGPSARPRRPRPAAGSRPPAPGRSVCFHGPVWT
ncbi:DUF4383 domain-containing protein [Actinophytocola sp.]|uniref:DUF4383 domain-containing protein n=1 Tax=Actinophytocola sp. TaxID=1872138 RepID=UPI0025BE9332|nr:DUF4383 domain-containing protein [Actinophytocola sp.]